MNSIFNKYIRIVYLISIYSLFKENSKNFNESNVTVSTLYKRRSELFEKKKKKTLILLEV